MAKTGEFHQASGRRFTLGDLRQYRTYGGVMEGYPTSEQNQWQIERLVAEHTCDTPPGLPYFIRPVENPIEQELGEHYRDGTPSALPAITCIGGMTSNDPTSRGSGDFSKLTVIWFQEEFAFPIDPAVMGQLMSLDWDRHAIDLDY